MRASTVRFFGLLIPVCAVLSTSAQNQATHEAQFISFSDPIIALSHVQLIDGTGAAARADQTIVVDHGEIAASGDSAKVQIPAGARELDLRGYAVYPGLVGMHEHLFYPSPGGGPFYNELMFSAPTLYLASGVTTARTAGSLEPYTDLNVKGLIGRGMTPGPEFDITGPYIEGPGGYSVQMPVVNSAEEARRLVDYWAAEGATSFKAYMDISHDALGAAIHAAHEKGMKITGHLCSVGFTEAAELGIDNLEHGFVVDTEFTPGKKRDVCPGQAKGLEAFGRLDLKSIEVQRVIRTLIDHKVAITSTLAVFEAFIPGKPPLEQRMIDAMSPDALSNYLKSKERAAGSQDRFSSLLRKEMDFEREFVKQGGLLMAGCDPTGNGGALPGFGDQRNLELLVEAGFKPEEAIQIYSYNAAVYLGRIDRIGSIAPRKQADLVVVKGNPSAHISDVENVKYVFKKGVAYDSEKLIDSVRGMVGNH